MTGSGWMIEPATIDALADILQIEEACFSAPWTRKMIEVELSGNPFAHFLLARRRGGGASVGLIVGVFQIFINNIQFFFNFVL